MKVKVAEASGPVLDWMIGQCEGPKGLKLFSHPDFPYVGFEGGRWAPSTDQHQGGRIIDREKISTWDASGVGNPYEWGAYLTVNCNHRHHQQGETHLIAAMRCYCVSKLGEEVDVPEELLK